MIFRILLVALFAYLAVLRPPLGAQAQRDVDGARPGPAIGSSIGTWSARDSSGAVKPLATLIGRRGALITFLRSAEW